MQRPPPEEYEALPERNMFSTNPAGHMARRLYQAYKRETYWRAMRVENVKLPNFNTRELGDCWPRLARLIMQSGWSNAERFIHVQFKYGPSSEKLQTLEHGPLVNMLTSEKAMKQYTQYIVRADSMLVQQLESAKLEFKCASAECAGQYPHLPTRERWELILMNKMLDLPPLFRYCVASSEGLACAKDLWEEGFQQFMSDPIGYTRTWEATIPAEMKAEAEELLQLKL